MTNAGPARLVAAFLSDPVQTIPAQMFPPDLMARLSSVCDFVSVEQLAEIDPQLLAQASVLITGWGAPLLDKSAFDAMPNLRLVAHTGGTLRPLIDTAAWPDRLRVTTAVTAQSDHVAEFTLAAIIFAAKKVLPLAGWLHTNREDRVHARFAFADASLSGATIGIVGASTIGRRVISLLQALPAKQNLLLFDPMVSEREAGSIGAQKCDLNSLMASSDVVSLHAPLLDQTIHMIGSSELRLLRDGATFINTARGRIVDQEALIAELASGRISAMVDVTYPEPLPPDSPLYGFPNVLLTPHIAGGFTRDLRDEGEVITSEIERFARGEDLAHEVRKEGLEWRA